MEEPVLWLAPAESLRTAVRGLRDPRKMSLRLDGKANAFVVPGRWVRGTSGLELDRTPLTAVQEGLALLKRGSQVTKHGRSGRPHATQLVLSDDETTLTWEAATRRRASLERAASIGLRTLRRGGEEKSRSVRIADVVELLVGHESAVFRRSGGGDATAHLSITLQLTGSLPAPPSADDADDAPAASR